jgi:hypothetical protein
METWKQIPGYEGLYEASDLGRIRSLDRLLGHYTGAKVLRRGRPIDGSQQRYDIVNLSRDGKHKSFTRHTIIALTFIGPKPKGMLVRHLDGNRQNNTAKNLAYGTSQDNSDDMKAHGTVLRGEQHGSAKLTAEEVRMIRELAPFHDREFMAEQFCISLQQLSNIIHRRQWKHV